MILLCLAMSLFAASMAAGELAIGADAPGFALINALDGKYVKFEPGKSPLSVVLFTCNQCPFANAFEPRIIDLARTYGKKGVLFFAVNPNDERVYAGETIDRMKERAVDKGYPFPYLKDTDSSVARAYGAQVTPHVFVVDSQGKVRYRGYVDDSAKRHARRHAGLSNALDEILSGKIVARPSTKAFGCSIKWWTGS
jgi:thiol-disulfide isomerase/thioredoxin